MVLFWQNTQAGFALDTIGAEIVTRLDEATPVKVPLPLHDPKLVVKIPLRELPETVPENVPVVLGGIAKFPVKELPDCEKTALNAPEHCGPSVDVIVVLHDPERLNGTLGVGVGMGVGIGVGLPQPSAAKLLGSTAQLGLSPPSSRQCGPPPSCQGAEMPGSPTTHCSGEA